MINKMNSLNLGSPIIIDRSMLPKRDVFPSEREVKPNGFEHDIVAGIDTNKSELQEMAELLSQPKLRFASFWGIEN